MLSREDEEAYYQALADRAERGELGNPDPDTILTGEDATKAGRELFTEEPRSSEMEEAVRKVLGSKNPAPVLEDAINVALHDTDPNSSLEDTIRNTLRTTFNATPTSASPDEQTLETRTIND